MTAALGSGQLDAITEQFKKQKLIQNKQNDVIAVPKKKITERVETIPSTKRASDG